MMSPRASAIGSAVRDIPVSAIVMTKDEERNIEKCLSGLARFCQVFVVDSGSSDRTVEMAKRAGAEVVGFHWDGRYPKKKQWCLDNLRFECDWALYVDADEEVPPELAEEIALTLRTPEHDGYFVGYDYVFLNRVLRHGRLVQKLVLLRRSAAHFPQHDDLDVGAAGEVELHFQPEVRGSVGMLRRRMVHRDFDTLLHFFERHNRYSDWEAVTRSRDGRRPRGEANVPGMAWKKKLFDAVPFKPLFMFAYSYLVRRGYRDGRAGFQYAVALAFYVWQIEVKSEEIRLRDRQGGVQRAA